ncbi:MAG: toll/interleukin-1 receptor domain-containing protein [Acidobacteriota bacterium]
MNWKPRVFFSYAWGSDVHNARVEEVARRLRDRDCEVRIDRRDLVPGDSILDYIEESLRWASKVLVMCEPAYAEKARKNATGVRDEYTLIRAEVHRDRRTRRIIPVLLEGDAVEAIPEALQDRFWIDLRRDDSAEFGHLVNTCFDESQRRPNVGRPQLPSFKSLVDAPDPGCTPGALRFLRWLYGENSLLKAPSGEEFPIAVRPTASTDPAVLPRALVPDSCAFDVTGGLIERRRLEGARLWDQATFTLRSVTDGSDGRIETIDCSIGAYFAAVNTCDVLEEELKAIGLMPLEAVGDFRKAYEGLPLRRGLHHGKVGATTLAEVWSGTGRSAAIAVSVLFVCFDGDEYRFYVRRRSPTVAVHPLNYHVVPSFMFQPMLVGHELSEFSLRYNVLREVAEELFSRPEGGGAEEGTTITTPKDLYLLPEVAALESLLESGAAELVVTGMSVNLLNLRPEVLCVLVIHDHNWFLAYRSEIKFCRLEYSQDFPIMKEYTVAFDLFEEDLFEAGGPLKAGNWVAPGAACIIAGVPAARRLVNQHDRRGSAAS